jgi:hypothetical protein
MAMGVVAVLAERLSRPNAGNNRRGFPMDLPVIAQDRQRGLGKRHETILGALAPMHVQHHAGAVDI